MTHTYLLSFFTFDHLPEDMQVLLKPFADLAQHISTTLPDGTEKTETLKSLLKVKEQAVRARLGC